MTAWVRPVDLAARAIRLVRARLALHRPAHLARLRAMPDVDGFVAQAFAASARNLAVASAFLPADVRRAGSVAFLACRVLDAFEDLSPDPCRARRDVMAAMEYLTGRWSCAPSTGDLSATRVTDRVELVVADRMPLLRSAIERLPDGRRAALISLLTRMAGAMCDDLAARDRSEPLDRSRYASAVLGDAVAYGIELVGCTVPDELARAAGRILQLANDIRDGHPPDALLEQVSSAVTDAPMIQCLLQSLRFPARSAARAAILYLALTTARSLLRNADVTPRGLVAHPLLLAVAAACSASSYRRTVTLLDRWVHRAPPLLLRRHLAPGAPRVDGDALVAYERPRARAFARFIARLHPAADAADALTTASWLGEQAGYFLRHLPDAPLTVAVASRRLFLLATDHVLAAAVRWVAPLGPAALGAVGDAMVRAAGAAQASGGRSEPTRELAHCLSAIVTRARGLAQRDADVMVSMDVELACALAAIDRAVTRSAFRTARRDLCAVLDRVERLAASAPEHLRGDIRGRREIAASIGWRD